MTQATGLIVLSNPRTCWSHEYADIGATHTDPIHLPISILRHQVAAEYGATAVHPGYGFLSENEEYCSLVEEAGLQWLGPTAKTMRDFALKHVAREIAKNAGVRDNA